MTARIFEGYQKQGEEWPLGGYAALLAGYGALFAAAAVGVRGRVSRRPPVRDIALLGLATHKLGRIATKDWVTSPLRAPFTEYVSSKPGGEVTEKSRGTGVRRAVGDLVTCQFCAAPWIATGLYVAYALEPRLTRWGAAIFASVAVSDLLNQLYGGLQEKREQLQSAGEEDGGQAPKSKGGRARKPAQA